MIDITNSDTDRSRQRIDLDNLLDMVISSSFAPFETGSLIDLLENRVASADGDSAQAYASQALHPFATHAAGSRR